MNNKIKGSEFERKVSKELSLWITNNKRDDGFWRTQSSGGRWTSRRKSNQETYNQDGDITSTHPDCNFFSEFFCIECKHYKEINFWDFINKNKNGILSWWKKLSKESKELNKIPVLIAKQNYQPVLWISSNKLYEEFKLENPIMKIWLDDEEIVIYKFEDIKKYDIKDLILCQKQNQFHT